MEDPLPFEKTTHGYPLLYIICGLFFLLSLGGIATLLVTDCLHHLKFSLLHQHLDAWPLIMIGLSYITLQLAIPGTRSDRIKGIFLGIAFLCWGSEQLLPISPIVTLLDEGADTIFVVDVGFIIWDRLNRTNPADKGN